MSEKKIDLTKSVYELCRENPGVADILSHLGFTDITKPGMLQTAGRFMTIPKGAALRRIGFDRIRQAFAAQGYEILEGGSEYE
ncbi:MAG: DUF1858 domain-containing protein [Christensenellales bacterium]